MDLSLTILRIYFGYFYRLGLHDYPQVIKHPMDLGTIKDKLKKKKYTTLFQVGEDVRLVWTNCMTYNQDGSDFFKLADSLHRKWDDKYTKLLQECSTTLGAPANENSAEAAAKVTLQDKRNFAKSLFGITKEDLGKVLVEVEAKCPSALVKNAAEDEVEFNIDKLTPSLLKELTKFVDSVVKGSKVSGGTTKKKKSQPASKKQKT